MLTRLAVLLALAGALLTFSLSPTLALSESDQDAAIAQLQSAMASLQSTVQSQQVTINSQATTIATQQAQINTLKGLTSSFSKQTDPTRTDGKKGTELFITGMNLHIVNGLKATNGDPTNTGTTAVNGLGNVIIGYNALNGLSPDGYARDFRTGSHNLIVGDKQNYTSFGGVVFGYGNGSGGPYASVTGGAGNGSSGYASSVSGGGANHATGDNSSVNGGFYNTASGLKSSISGGEANKASAYCSSVSGGGGNTANAVASSVSGGEVNFATNEGSSISGGENNTASGKCSSVSGGNTRSATDIDDWVAGELFQDQ